MFAAVVAPVVWFTVVEVIVAGTVVMKDAGCDAGVKLVLIVAVAVLVALRCSDPVVLELVDVEAVVEVDDAGRTNDDVGCV